MLAIVSLSGVLKAQAPTNGLVGYWPFNGNANDESGNGHNGTVNGATLTNDRFGNINSAYNFNGIDQYITTLNSSAMNYSGGYTFSTWINFTQVANQGGNIFSKHTEGFPYGFSLHISNSQLLFYNSGTYLYTTDLYNDGLWHNVVCIFNGSKIFIYVDNVLKGNIASTYISNNSDILIGKSSGNYFYNGKSDDIRIYNRALTPSEITLLFQEGLCSDTVVNDTSIHYVSDIEFEASSPEFYYKSTDSLTQIGGCDSIVHHYSKFVYNPTYCSVTDTLIINANLTGFNPIVYQNTIKIYPNPSNDHIIVDFGGNYSTMNGYSMKITNTLNQIVYTTPINAQQTTINLSNWTGNGIYFVHLIDAQSNTIDIRKIVLQ